MGNREDDVRRAGAGLEQEVSRMEHRAQELGSEIEAVREDFKRKRNNSDVVGLPPEPEAVQEKSPGPGEDHSAGPEAPPTEGDPTESEAGAAMIVEDSVPMSGNPGDEGVHGEDPD